MLAELVAAGTLPELSERLPVASDIMIEEAPENPQYGGTQNFDRRYDPTGQDLLFDLERDPAQEHPLHDPELEAQLCRKLVQAMRDHDSPAEQFIRLGLEEYV